MVSSPDGKEEGVTEGSLEFRLQEDFIELDNLLKALRLVNSGAEARQHIQAGSVKVNGQVEARIRRKLRPGDNVEFGKQQVRIIAKE